MTNLRRFTLLVPLAVGSALAYVVVTAIAHRAAHQRAPSPASTRAAAAEVESPSRPMPAASVAFVHAAVLPPVVAMPHNEATLMDALRRSFVDKPLETLEAARDLERRYPDSPNAAERSWIEIRSLVNLGRFHEARDQARVLAQRFPGSEWAVDAQRHLLVNPLDYPSREEIAEHQASSTAEGEPSAP